jgi:hypothetical protein
MLKYHPTRDFDLEPIPFPGQGKGEDSVRRMPGRDGSPGLRLSNATRDVEQTLTRMQRQLDNLRTLLPGDPAADNDPPRAA